MSTLSICISSDDMLAIRSCEVEWWLSILSGKLVKVWAVSRRQVSIKVGRKSWRGRVK